MENIFYKYLKLINVDILNFIYKLHLKSNPFEKTPFLPELYNQTALIFSSSS
jgi:hypothetical protein